MYSNEPIRFFKNRKGEPDIIVKWLDVASVLTWFLILFVLALFFYASPGEETFLDRLFDVKVRDYWDTRLLNATLILSTFQFILSAFSVFLNTRRLKRKGDRMRLSLIISTVFSLAMMVCLVVFL